MNELQLQRCITEQNKSEMPISNVGNVFINGLDVVCLQTCNLDRKSKLKKISTDCIEAYADQVDLMSDIAFTESRIS